ncbi:hypothetical protein [Novosphingobium sp.]|uniref:hypothetical protein n=1 Tax=Novosphingobium sp. TaxID=1874826 RepID=UPI0027359763|nr:hypothetical protein [Novosphingobium sp.]MDP3907788.1 hypothetical protein [Novosphingobium sp.]
MTNRIGRRREARLRVRLAAKVITRAGAGNVVLCDLSRQGASVIAGQAFGCSGPAVLQWGGHEVFGDIQWCSGGRIGIRFDQPLPQAVLLEARQLNETERMPADHELAREQARRWVQGVHRV